MRSRTRFGWLVTLGSLLCLALIAAGISFFVTPQPDLDATAVTRTPTPQVAQATATTPLPAGNDWTQYRFDLTGTGNNAEDIISSDNVSRLSSAWTYDNKGSPYASTPAVVDGVIYTPSGNTFSAYDLRTGAKRWTFTGNKPANGLINSSVAVDTSLHLAYFGAPNDYVYAIDIYAGVAVWTVKLGEPSAGAYIWSSPVLAHGNVYIGMASRNDVPCVRGAVYALDGATGVIRWTHYTAPEGELGGGVWSSVTVDAEEHAILATSGNPCVNYVSDYQQDSIIAMDWDTGKTIWHFQALQADYCDCDFGGGPVTFKYRGQKYIVAGNKQGIEYGLVRTTTGVRLAWQTRIAHSQAEFNQTGGIFQPPSYKDGMIYVAGGTTLDGSCTGAVWGLRADTGTPVWRNCTKKVIAAGAITGDLFFMAQHDSLDAYNLKTGAILWHADIPGEVWGGTVITHGYILVGSLKGKLYCFRLSGGS